MKQVKNAPSLTAGMESVLAQLEHIGQEVLDMKASIECEWEEIKERAEKAGVATC